MKKQKMMILTSAMGLGTYIPALHIRDYLEREEYDVSVRLYESYFSDEAICEYEKSKSAYHKDMRVAIAGHKLVAKRLNKVISEEVENKIIDEWMREEISNFILISGNWIDFVRKYKEESVTDINAYIVHMDIGVAPSFKRFDNSDGLFKEICPITDEGVHAVVENHFVSKNVDNSNSRRLFVHGGGWGMGDYKKIAQELSDQMQAKLLLAAYDRNEMDEQCDYTLLDKEWKPWITDAVGRHQYPKMHVSIDNKKIEEIDNSYSNGLYNLYSGCDAIISKPGGSTIMDSLIVETPVIFLTPIAEHERVNADVCVKLGLGMYYEQWKDSGFDFQILNDLKNNIKNLKKNASGVSELIVNSVNN